MYNLSDHFKIVQACSLHIVYSMSCTIYRSLTPVQFINLDHGLRTYSQSHSSVCECK